MITKLNSSTQNKRSAFWMCLASATLSLISLATVLYAIGELKLLYREHFRTYSETTYKVDRLSFCYDNRISPCTDATIREWNAGHPEDQFYVK